MLFIYLNKKGGVGTRKNCAFDGCDDSLWTEMYLHNFMEYQWHPLAYHAMDIRLPLLRPFLQKPANYRWTENYPVCGDGILHEEEECECLPNGCFYISKLTGQVAIHNCCDRHRCKKISWDYACASGSCCDLGRCDHSPGDLCREAVNDCDIPEYCQPTGECQEDNWLANGSPCGVKGQRYAQTYFL